MLIIFFEAIEREDVHMGMGNFYAVNLHADPFGAEDRFIRLATFWTVFISGLIIRLR